MGSGDPASALFTLVDIGSRYGIDSRWRRFADALHVIAIDADANAETGDSQGLARHDLVRAAVGGSTGPANLYLTRKPWCSSALRPNRALLARKGARHVSRTLVRIAEAVRSDNWYYSDDRLGNSDK